MALLKFKMVEVKKLVDELNSATEFSPIFADLYNPELFPNGEPLDKQGRTEKEALAAGERFFTPSSEQMLKDKVKPSLTLVGDQGVYLMTNASLPGTPSSRGTVVYAQGCNPELDDDFYENKRDLFGCDDGADTVPVEWFELALDKGKRVFTIKLTSNSMGLAL